MKTLQKTLSAIFAVLAIALFAACSSDSADSDDFLAGTTWTCEYEYFDDDYEVYTAVMTLYFQSGGKVTMNDITEEENGTYNVSGSTVTLNLEETGTIELIYSSSDEELIYYSSMEFTLDDSSSLETFSADSLAGTTWKYEYTDSDYDVIKFGEDGKSFTAVYYADGKVVPVDDSGEYIVDGTTVTVNYEDRPQTRFVYSGGKLVLLWVFTKDGTI